MLALVSSAYVLPSLIGPALAGLIADHLGWRWTFLGLAPLLPLAAGLAVPALRRFERISSEPRNWRWIGAAVRLAIGTAFVTSGLGSHQTIFLSMMLTGIGALLVVPAFRQLISRGAQRAAGLPAALATTLLLNMAFFGVDACAPLASPSVRHQTASFAGLALTAATISWTAGAWFQARAAARQRRRILVIAGLVLVAIGVIGIVVMLQPNVPVVLAPLAWAVAGLGMGLASPTLSLLALELAPTGQEGASTSTMQLAGVLGIAVGTGIGGVIIGSGEAATSVSLMSIVIQNLLMIGMLIIAVWIVYRLPTRSRTTMASNASGMH